MGFLTGKTAIITGGGRAVLSDGTTLIKSVTASGVVSETIHK